MTISSAAGEKSEILTLNLHLYELTTTASGPIYALWRANGLRNFTYIAVL
jgi:hypothetical protein